MPRVQAPRTALLVVVAVATGLLLRGHHYFRCPAVWHDEAALILNALKLSWAEMFGPLLYAEAAPPLFLVIVRAIAQTLGDDPLALRSLPFGASCVALVLFADLARRSLAPGPAAVAVGLLAVSDRLLWHSCEAKPYAVDVFLAVVAAAWFWRTRGDTVVGRCLPVAAVAPLAVWVSFPACFVGGGLLVGLWPAAVRSGLAGRLAYGAAAASLLVSFAALVVGPVTAQRCEAMDQCWTSHFPDWSRPDRVPVWAVVQTFEVARYCLLPVGQVCAILAGFGAAALWRKPDGRELLAVLLAPLAAALFASLLHKYPYGGMRVEVFAAPALCLLTAAGLADVLPRLLRRSRVLAAACLLAVLPPFVLAGYRLIEPWPRAASDRAAAFVLARRQPGDLILGNFWEHQYYFRREAGFRAWQGEFLPAEARARRAWVVHTAEQAVPVYPFPLPAGWEVVGRTAFERTSVFELCRRSPAAADTAPRPPLTPRRGRR